MDEILASIRQIISDQNDEADRAAEKAADEVANPLPAKNNIDSIIGSVAADHWGAVEESSEMSTPEPFLTQPEPERSAPEPSLTQPEIEQLIADREKMATRVKAVTAARPAKRPAPVSLEDLVEPEARPVRPAPVSAIERHASDVLRGADDPYRGNIVVPKAATGTYAAKKPDELLQQFPTTDSALERLIARRSVRTVEAARPVVQNPVVGETQSPVPLQKSPNMNPPVAPAVAKVVTPSPTTPPVAAAPLVQPQTPAADDAVSKPAIEQVITASVPQQTAISKPPTAKAPLLSSGLNKSINASFERLAVSMLAERKDEMDQMMVDIMRPMLQDWLEDNLPSLVERLVREEIERVSRGVH